MTAIQVQSREQWLALRAECVVTCSMAPALVTAHPYATPFSLYQRAIGNLAEPEENEAMAAGTDAEFMMPARAARVRPGLKLMKNGYFFRHDRLRFGGTPDFWDSDGGCWQAKCVSPDVFYSDWKNEPPLWVLLQHQAEYLVTGCRKGGVLCLVRDRHFSTYLYDVPAHDAAMAKIEAAVERFQRMVDDGEEPPPDFVRDAELIIQLASEAIPNKVIDLSADNYLADLCARYKQASATAKGAEAEKDALKAEIFTKIGDASRVTCGAFSISAGMNNGTEDRTITADMVGTVLKGRKGYRNLRLTERDAA